MSITVMVYSSKPENRKNIVGLLQKMGLSVITEASDTQQALRLARSSRPNLIIYDIDSFEYRSLETATILANEKIAPLLLITDPHQQRVIAAMREDYIMSYVVRPLTRWTLQSAIHTVLSAINKLKEKESEITKLKNNLETRKLVEKAKHLVMKELSLSEDEAYRRMQRLSMNKGVPLKQVAEAIILKYEL